MTDPALPPGFTLDAEEPPVPAGFTVDAPQVSRPVDQAPRQPRRGFFETYANRPGNPLLNAAQDFITEPAAQLVTGTAGAVIGGWRGLYDLATGQGIDKAVGDIERTQQAITYQPRTPAGKVGSAIVSYPFEKLAQGANYVGGKSSEGLTALGASPEASAAVGAGISTGIQFGVPVLVSKMLRGKQPGTEQGAEAVKAYKANERAKTYVNTRTGVTWDSLAESTRDTLRQIGYDAANFDKLDPAAAARQLQLASLKKPISTATRGQVTRDPIQLQREELLKATEAGAPLRDMALEQNRTIIENLDILKGKKQQAKLATGGKATDMESAGASVQDAARLKLETHKKFVSDLYKKAEQTGELQGKAGIKPIYEVLKGSPDKTHLGFVQSWLNQMKAVTKTKDGIVLKKLTLKELEDLRQAAVAQRMDGGTQGYYAGKVISAIDEATEGAGGEAYKAARAARKAQALEFEDQGAVEALVSNASRTDRAVALENTWRKTVVSGSIDDLKKVQKSLLTGGDSATRTAGRKAWRDLQAQTIDYIRQESTKGITNQAGESNLTYAGMKQAINRVGPEKLKIVLGEKDAAAVQNILKAAETLKTEPAGTGVRGSNTVNKILNIMDKSLLTKIPGIGQTAEGVVRAAGKISELGKGGREARQATTSQLNDLARQSTDSANRLNLATETKNKLYQYGPAAATAAEQRKR